MSVTTVQPLFVSDVIVHEVSPIWSREQVILKASNAVTIGAVLAKILLGTATAAAKAGGNTGNGTITMDATTPILAGAKPGIYTVRFTAATAFIVEDPDGFDLGIGATGTAFADDLKFAIAAGGTAFVAGDGFDITVTAASAEKYVPLSLTATDGSQIPAAISIENKASVAADQKLTVEARGAVCDPAFLVWPAGATDTQKAQALAILKTLGIIARSST